jgi:hypothetical protein
MSIQLFVLLLGWRDRAAGPLVLPGSAPGGTDHLSEAKAETVVLCDANFGTLRQDVEFVEDLLEIRKEYGYPFALETSWAKNKSKIFYEIVSMMAKSEMRSSFTLALQTLADPH